VEKQCIINVKYTNNFYINELKNNNCPTKIENEKNRIERLNVKKNRGNNRGEATTSDEQIYSTNSFANIVKRGNNDRIGKIEDSLELLTAAIEKLTATTNNLGKQMKELQQRNDPYEYTMEDHD